MFNSANVPPQPRDLNQVVSLITALYSDDDNKIVLLCEFRRITLQLCLNSIIILSLHAIYTDLLTAWPKKPESNQEHSVCMLNTQVWREKICCTLHISPLPFFSYPNLGYFFLFLWRSDPIPGHDLPSRDLTIKLIGHTALGRTPMDEWSVRRRDLSQTTHNTYKKRTSMPFVGFEPTISGS